MKGEVGQGGSPNRPRPHRAEEDAWAAGRQLDAEKTGERAKAPPNLIRRPIRMPKMERVQGA